MVRRIANELKSHALFTSFGAITGIIIMAIMVLGNVPSGISHTLFYILHPVHVVLSAIVTTAMYKRHSKGKVWAVILIGYVGSICIARGDVFDHTIMFSYFNLDFTVFSGYFPVFPI